MSIIFIILFLDYFYTQGLHNYMNFNLPHAADQINVASTSQSIFDQNHLSNDE